MLLLAALLAETLRLTTPMSAPRAAHTSTTLADGRVLIAGGFGADERAVAGAELFDPRTKRFVAAPPMLVRRQSHTATRLRDHRVLLLGGYDARGAVTASAEVFDGTRFVAAGSMTRPRAGHIATLLADGRVLITGGAAADGSFLDSAEIYDPSTGRFAAAGRMTRARESHTATLLPDGRVLIAGGHQPRPVASTEIFNPARGTFTPGPSMTRVRHKHDALLLPDGRVWIIGGADERDNLGAYDATEVYERGTMRASTKLSLARYKHRGTSIVLPNGEILLAGGNASAEVFAGEQSRIVRSDSALSGQFSAASLLADGRVLITGGYGGGRGPTAKAWIYRPAMPRTTR
jgi:hypothetical protein